jgi:hypothetical protein
MGQLGEQTKRRWRVHKKTIAPRTDKA